MKFIVRIYYSGYCTYEVEAKDEYEAIRLARSMPMDEIELISTLEEWEECNDVEVITDNTD